jgi:CspA family cold shock protein
MTGPRASGRVKWYDERRGYGFIVIDGGGDVFVHRSGLAEGVVLLDREQAVEFDIVQGRKGNQASEVRPV